MLDVGCGPGTDTLALARIVGDRGHAAGVDTDWSMVSAARTRALEAGLSERTTHVCASASRLPFADNHFDSVRSERLFQHVAEPEAVLAEMARVTRSGGGIVVADTDHSTFSVCTAEQETEWKLRMWQTCRLRNGTSGRRLYGQFKAAGLRDVAVEVHPLHTTDYEVCRFLSEADIVESEAIHKGIVTKGEVEAYRADCRARADSGAFFASVAIMAVGGQAP